MALLRKFSRSPYLQVLGQRYMVLLGLNLVLGLFNPTISMAGHIGGAVGGCLVVMFLPPLVEKISLQENRFFQFHWLSGSDRPIIRDILFDIRKN